MNRRQWERIAYPAELQLTATGHVLPAKLVDLSERGMQVVVPVKLYAGNAIRAELPTPRAALVVTGRVCWTAVDRTDGTAQTRAGIAFDALQPAAEEGLRALASERPGTSVSLQLPGSDEPVRASAIRTSQGVRLSFTLPFLREGTIVTMQPSEADAEVARVVQTHVYAGGTGAETRIELLVEPCTETRKRRFVHYDAVQASQREPISVPTPTTSDGLDTLTVPKRRILAKVGYGLSLLAAVWLVSRFSESGSGEAVASPAQETQASNHSATWAPRSTQQASATSVAVQAQAASAVAPHATAKPMGAASPALGAQPAATDTQPATDDKVVAPAQLVPSAKPVSDAKPAGDTTVANKPESAAPAPRVPVVSSAKDTTEIFVPVTGSLAGLVTKIWSDPPAVVVEIPRGIVGLTRRRYDLHADGVVGLSVGRPGGVTQLRVYVNSILSQYEATVVPGGVSIRIKRDLQSP